MRVLPSRQLRACAALALAGLAVTCRDDPTGPGGGRAAALAVAPVMPASLNLAAFSISVDSVRVVVIRPLTDTLADRRVAFPADSSGLQLPLSVLLRQQVETLTVALEYRGGGFVLFTGTQTMEVRAGPPGTNAPTPIAMTFVGPGAGVDSLVLGPVDSVVSWGDSLRYRVLAFQGGAPVTNFYVSWTTSDTLTARVNAFGTLRAPSFRDTVFVKVMTPSGAADSVRAAFMPRPSALALVSGINQTGLPGSVLPVALRVRVTAPDALGVPQVVVRFRAATGGGAVADSVVVTNDSGFAQTVATLGTVVGPNSYTATVTGLPVVQFNAAAAAGAAVRLQFTVQPGAAAAGQPITPAIVVTAFDGAGNVATSFASPVTISLLDNPGGAVLNGNIGLPAVNGVATFANLRLNIPSQGYTLLASATGLASDTSAAFGVAAGAPFRMRIIGGNGQSGGVGSPLGAQLGVEVTDSVNNPIVGFTGVVWASPDGGTVAPGAPTDSLGLTFATWTLGLGLGTQTATATVTGLVGSPLTFTALAAPAGTTLTWRGAVDTDWNNVLNWTPTTVPGLSDNVFLPASVANQPVLVALAPTFNRLIIETGASLDVGGFGLTVVGDVIADGPITGTSSVVLTGAGTVQGTLPNMSVSGSRALSGTLTLTGSVFIGVGADLTLAGHAATVAGTLTVDGDLLMQNPADTLSVNSLAQFRSEGGSTGELTAGVLRLRGSFSQLNASGPFFNTFAPSGTHKTVLEGTTLQGISFASPGNSFFNSVEFANSAGVTFNTGGAINGVATISTGTVTGVSGPVNVGQLADAAGGRWQVQNTTAIGAVVSLPDSLVTNLAFSGAHTLAKGFTVVGFTGIPSTATVGMGGHRVVVRGSLDVQGHLLMQQPADTVRVTGAANFQSAGGASGDMTAGALLLEGGLTQLTASGPFVNTFAPSGTHKTVFTGGGGQSVSFADPGASFFQDVEFGDAGGVAIGDAAINGSAVITAGIVSGGGRVFLGQLADAAGGRWQVANTTVTGPSPSLPDSLVTQLTFDGTQTLSKGFTAVGDALVPATAALTVGGHRMVVRGALSVQGHLLMQVPADTVAVTGSALFQAAGGAAGDMTAGVLVLEGDFDQQPSSGPFFNTFVPSGSHTTVFAGPLGQSITFAAPGASFFNHVVLDGPVVVSLTTPAAALGQLRSPPGATNLNGVFTFSAAGLDVDGLVVDGTTIASTNGTLTRFDNVIFTNTAIDDTALTISHPGAATPFQLTNVTFNTTPTTGAYISATDNTTDANVLTLAMVGAVANNGPGFTVVAGGAVVNWALVEFGPLIPASPVAGAAFTTQVLVRNGAGAVDTLYNDSVTVALGANPGSDTLTGTLIKVANRGVASFDDLSLDKTGAGYTLQATARNVGTVSSAGFTVVAAAISSATSTVAAADSTVSVGLGVALSLQARDAFGNLISTGGATIVFTQSGGTSVGLIAPSPAADSGNGTYHATFTGVTIGTPVTIGATINGNPVTTPLPTLRVLTTQTTHSADITTDETWTAAGSPHIVTAYLKVRSDATLTIEPGATVRFDAGAGLQVGDTTLAEAGTLLMDGTANPIVLTANTGTPTPGFWKGVELQLATSATWRRVLFEWGGSPRAPMAPLPESCLLSVNAQGAPVTLDSVRFRQCVHAGIHHFGGTLVITRSVFDSATGSGIHADFNAALTVDSSLFRGSGNEGLQILNPGVRLVSASGNQFLDHGGRAVSMFGTQLHGLHTQGAISGNGNDSIYVQAGRVDTTVTAFTIAAQPVPYLVDGLVQVGRAGAGGATVTLDSGLVMAFTAAGGLQVGDTSGPQRGQIRTRSTAANPALLRNRAGGSFWRGVGLGLSAAPDTLRHVRLVKGGGSAVFRPANLAIYKPSGGDPFYIDSVAVDSSANDGIEIARAPLVAGSRVVRSTFDGNSENGLSIFTTGTAPAVLDSLNSFARNGEWPIALSGHALGGHTAQLAFDTTGPGFDEVLVTNGHTFTVHLRPPAQLPYVTNDSALLVQGGGGTFTLEPNLVMQFGHASGLVIGDSAAGPAGTIVSLGTSRADAPRLTSRQSTPAPADWYGLEIGRLASNTRLANVRIEFAGDSIAGRDAPRFGLWVRNAQPHALSVDSVMLVSNGAPAAPGRLTAGLFVSAAGSGLDVRRSVADSTLGGAGFGTLVRDVKLVDDTARGNDLAGIVVRPAVGTQFRPAQDSIAGNVLTGNPGYPLQVTPGALPALHLQDLLSGNGRDTIMVVDSGFVTDTARLRHYPGVPYFVDRRVIVDSGATLFIEAGDTIGFNFLAGLDIGTSANAAALRVAGTSVLPVLMTRPTFPQATWRGIHFRNVAPSSGFPEIRNLIVERAGWIGTCTGDCQPPFFGSIHWSSPSGENVTFDSIIVRHPFAHAIHVDSASAGTVVVTNSQFYDTMFVRFGPAVFKSRRGSGLQVSLSDIYRYASTAVDAAYQGFDSVDVKNNYWGDAEGMDTTFGFTDSLGRASTGGNAVSFLPFATVPHFPVGAPTRMVPALDSLLFGPFTVGDTIGDPDSLRVRVLDAQGRGVDNVGVAWSQSHAGLMFPDPGQTAGGGRHATRWKLDVVATQQFAFATGVGPGVTFSVDPQADSTVSTDWRIVQAGLGGVIAPDSLSVTYPSSNRTTVLVTRAVDQYGNITQPSGGFFFADVPSSGAQFYGTVDSVVQDSLVFFRPTSAAPGTYQLQAFYDAPVLIGDSIAITIVPNAAGVRVDNNAFFPGVQDTVPLLFHSLCPGAGGCSLLLSEVPLVAEVVDSGGAPLGNALARFQWTRTSLGAVADSVTGGAIADTAWTRAVQNGVDTMFVVDTALASPTFGRADTVPIQVYQIGAQIQFTPTFDTLLVGDSAVFQADVLDQGGQPLANDTIHFRVDSFAPGVLTITDTSVLNQVTVRLDSTPFGVTFISGRWGRPLADTAFGYFPGDTLLGQAVIFNPATANVATSVTPYAVAANPVTNRVYVTHEGSDLVSVIDGASDIVLATINALPTKYVAVNSATNRGYVTSATGTELTVIDGATNQAVFIVPLGTAAGGMAVDEGRGLVYVPAEVSGAPRLLVVADTSANPGVVASVALPERGIEAAYNPATNRIYVTTSSFAMQPERLIVINAVTRTVIDTVAVGAGARGVAVSTTLNRVYVANTLDQTLTIVDGATGAVLTTTSLFFAPERISVDEAAGMVYVSGTSGVGVMRVDAATGLIRGNIAIGAVTTDAHVNPATGKVYVAVPVFDGVTVLKF